MFCYKKTYNTASHPLNRVTNGVRVYLEIGKKRLHKENIFIFNGKVQYKKYSELFFATHWKIFWFEKKRKYFEFAVKSLDFLTFNYKRNKSHDTIALY